MEILILHARTLLRAKQEDKNSLTPLVEAVTAKRLLQSKHSFPCTFPFMVAMALGGRGDYYSQSGEESQKLREFSTWTKITQHRLVARTTPLQSLYL